LDSGDVLTKMTESDVNRFAIRYGLWNNTQTIVTLSTPYRSDHLRVLDILRSKIVTILPDSTVVRYNMSLTVRYAEGGSLKHANITSTALSIDEIDTLKATDATLMASLKENATANLVQITKHNATTSPHQLTYPSGLQLPEQAIGKYINITLANSSQGTTSTITETAMVQIFYRETELDRTGNGWSGDPGDIDENTLALYIFDVASNGWKKLKNNVNGVTGFGISAINAEVYGEKYAGYVWVQVPLAKSSLFGIAGLLVKPPPNRPPTTNPLMISNLGTFAPAISWTYADQNNDSQAMYEVEVWTAPGGSVTKMWDPPMGIGTSTSVVYAGVPLEPGQTYYVRVRAFDGLAWSVWSETSFSITAQYALTMFVIGQGTVTPGNGTYSARTKVGIKALPESGWAFLGWTGDASSTANTTITMNGNKTITAVFIPKAEVNRPPDVLKAHASMDFLWPANGEMVPVTVEGVTDPNGDRVFIEIVGIESNEPSGFPPDYYGVYTDTAWLRAERLPSGQGRVYTITFVASDGKGANVISFVSVLVPLMA